MTFAGTSDFDDDGEVDSEAMERIRIYQVNRLKYYYAVAIFNSKEAADKVSLSKTMIF